MCPIHIFQSRSVARRLDTFPAVNTGYAHFGGNNYKLFYRIGRRASIPVIPRRFLPSIRFRPTARIGEGALEVEMSTAGFDYSTS